jgi:hypothetical protein
MTMSGNVPESGPCRRHHLDLDGGHNLPTGVSRRTADHAGEDLADARLVTTHRG